MTSYEAVVWLPFPPSVNNLFPAVMVRGKSIRVPSKQYKHWRKEADLRLMAARIRRIEQPVVVSLELTPRDKRPRDADNYSKAVLDALVRCNVLVGDDNRWVKAVTPYWEEPNFRTPGVIVRIRLAKLEVKQPTLPGLFDASEDKAAI